MANKNSFVVTLLGLIVLGILITASEGIQKKGKFRTPGGSHCKWIEKNKHNGSDVSYTLVCRCHSKRGGTMRYRCHYKTSFHGSGNHRQFSDSFLQIIKGSEHGCSKNSFMVGEDSEATMVARGEATASDCK